METKHLPTLLLLIWFPLAAYSQIYQQIPLPSGLTGPESLAFGCLGEGPYSGLSDGRIFKYQDPIRGWRPFAFTSPLRNSSLCDGTSNIDLAARCGRPIGLQFHKRTCELYVTDPYYGLLKVPRNGGRAIPLATSAQEIPFRFTNSLDVDSENHVVYFTDSSTRFEATEVVQIIQTGDNTGRFIKYDLRTNKVTVLLSGLMFADGVAMSKEKDYVIVSEYSKNETLKYWLQGPKAKTSKFFARTPGPPDNINTNTKGEFWVALNKNSTTAGEIIGVRIDEDGQILQNLVGDGIVGSVSEVEERNGFLLIGSVVNPYVGITTV
ncbi:hypothetical protein ACHQM5_001037 [Ranunculus cassubicifolius]